MSTLHVIGAVVAFGLFVYLCVALLKPEIFE
jgi:K+-transporting ATPase KdpF subunit